MQYDADTRAGALQLIPSLLDFRIMNPEQAGALTLMKDWDQSQQFITNVVKPLVVR